MPAETKDMEVPGYKTIIPNAIYGKDIKSDKKYLEVFPLTHIMSVARYTIPSEKDILSLIRSDAKSEFSGLSEFYKNENFARINLQSALKESLSSKERNSIIEGEKKTIACLKKHYSQDLQPGKAYIGIVHGNAPSLFLDIEKYDCGPMSYMLSQFSKKTKEDILEKIIAKSLEKECALNIRLDNKNSLPDKSEIDLLLSKGVKDCDAFRLIGEYNYNEAIGQINFLYSALNSPEKVEKIRDVSEKILKIKAISTIIGFATFNSKKETMREMIDFFKKTQPKT